MVGYCVKMNLLIWLCLSVINVLTFKQLVLKKFGALASSLFSTIMITRLDFIALCKRISNTLYIAILWVLPELTTCQ